MASSPKYKSLRGMPDLVSEDAASLRWIEEKAREVFQLFGFKEIETPILEETGVFTRSIGEDTDIVEKEMYSFTDRGGKNISLRPEGTAPIIRAYIEHSLYNDSDLVKLFYSGPMFRGERPQKGRLRQFHQIGAEVIGTVDPFLDAELILNLDAFLKRIGVSGFTVLINSIGCAKDRSGYKKALKTFLDKNSGTLCEDCKRRSRTNVLRVLDCKQKSCKDVLKGAPSILESLCGSCMNDYEKLKNILSETGINFREKTDLVRGLDYYTNTIFEVIHPSLGAQDAIAAGGRYDNLTKQMGGPDVGATGYAVGVERLLLIVDKKNIPSQESGVLVIPIDDNSRAKTFEVADALRASGIPSEMAPPGKSLKGQMRRAHKEAREYVIIIGGDEIKSGELLLKNMESGEQQKLTVEKIIDELKAKR